MDRDRRLTGYLRGQTDKVEAPTGFELNNPWRVGIAIMLTRLMLTAIRWRNGSSEFHGWRYPNQFLGNMDLLCTCYGSKLILLGLLRFPAVALTCP